VLSRGKVPRAVVVTRGTEYEELLRRHGTREQAAFFLRTRDQDIDVLDERHARQQAALGAVLAAIPTDWRRTRVDRSDLSRFVFEPDDVIVPVGQDGLVANAAKYLDDQPVLGINPDPEQFDGVLVRHPADRARELLLAAAKHRVDLEQRTMVEVRLDDGQRIVALNELFVGQPTHQSARYRIGFRGEAELQSSSGLIVTTGTGATGWARSIVRERVTQLALPAPSQPALAFFVREAGPSVATETRITDGLIERGDSLDVVSRMEHGVAFGDGIEADRLAFGWGARARITVSDRRLRLVV